MLTPQQPPPLPLSQNPTFNPGNNNTQTSQNAFKKPPPQTFFFDPNDNTQIFHNNFTPPPQGQNAGNSPQTGGPQWDPQRNTWYIIDKHGHKVRLIKNGGTNNKKAIPSSSYNPPMTITMVRSLLYVGEEGTKRYNIDCKGIDTIENIFPNDYKPPNTILTAIKKISKGTSKSSGGDAEKTIDPLKVTQSCNLILYEAVSNFILIPENYPNMTIEEAKTVASYAYNGDNSIEMSPFQEINGILRRRNPDEIRGSIDMIYMLLKSLRKIGLKKHEILYRGARAELVDGRLKDTDGNFYQPDIEYKKGEIITFYSLTSTSTSRSGIKEFLIKDEDKKTDKTGKKERRSAVFRIHNGEGYNVAPFSMFPQEKEVVMDIESTFEVSDIKEEVWDYDLIDQEENDTKHLDRNPQKHHIDHRTDKFSEDVYNVTVIELEYRKPDRLPFHEMDAYIQNEGDKTIPPIGAYITSKAPHAVGRSEDEFIIRPTNAGRAIKLNMRTGEIRDVGSTVGLPKGWVEMTEIIEGVEVTYYTDGEVKQYKRPPLPQ